MQNLTDFQERLSTILHTDRRYKTDAYLFVMTALDRAVRAQTRPRHVTGRELLQSIRQEAKDQFGPMAAAVLEHWGIKNSLDFGHIVFNMVREGILSKTETDTLEDFKDIVFFKDLFDEVLDYHL